MNPIITLDQEVMIGRRPFLVKRQVTLLKHWVSRKARPKRSGRGDLPL